MGVWIKAANIFGGSRWVKEGETDEPERSRVFGAILTPAPNLKKMSKPVKGAVNFQRRTWDKEEYERRAVERSEREGGGGGGGGEAPRGRVDPALMSAVPPSLSLPSTKLTVKDGLGEAAPYRDAEYGAQGPEGSKRAYLTSRTEDLNLEAKVKQRRVVTDATPLAQAGGYHCELCQCTLTDSSTWLDHINGTKHQRRLGVSMRVEAAGVDAVKARLLAVKSQAASASAAEVEERDKKEALAELNIRVSKASEEERARKKARKGGGGGEEGGKGKGGGGSAAAAAAAASSSVPIVFGGGGGGEGGKGSGGGEGGEGEGEGGEDADIFAAMGFSGFGGGK